ncbi:hypothetical protein PVAND_006407 [Polypedilum vanderplanki]|uniref:F-box domain-containing protein n=1 Tax=Polypedilum vanderplanki TaxID=319348 RepID=A0A9J6C3Z3_POLVA|nr:hypothetical protein PVAND_006407 [Polypedilum vanderplanki]
MTDNIINNLPDEVFLEIFNYFNGKSLKSLMFVCKRWAEIISGHASSMKKLPVNMKKLLLDYNGNISHNFHTLNIEHINIFNHDLHDYLLISLGRSVQCLNISYCVINANHLKSLLENLIHLNELAITKSRISDDPIIEKVNENEFKIKKFKVTHINNNILKYLNNIQVSEMEIIDANNYKINHEYLIEFILRQKSMRSLIVEELNNNVNSLFLTNDLKHATFRLKKFTGLFCTNLTRHEFFNENLISFLNVHANSLETLKITGSSLSPNTYKFSISHLSNLYMLELNPNSIPQENSFYKNLPKNTNLKVFHIESTITRTNINGVLQIIRHYSNISNLMFFDTDEFISNDLFYAISHELKFLLNLSVLNFNKNFIPTHKIQILNSFSIKILNDIDQFLNFITLNNTLEKINVGWIKRDFGEEIVEKIITQPRLQYIKFGGRFIANKRIYEVISRDYKNLRTLELVVNNYDDIKNLKFIFPLDRNNFIPKCLYFEEFNDREPLND